MSAGRRRILFTRPLEAEGPEEALLHEQDRAALELDVLKFVPGPDRMHLAARIRETAPECIALTSRQASLALAECLREPGAPECPPCVAVGENTARPLRGLPVPVDVAPGPGAEALAAFLLARTPRPGRVLFLRGDLALETLADALCAAGVAVDELEVYRTQAATVNVAPLLSALGAGLVDAAVFRSPSAVQSLRQNLEGPDWRALMRLPVVAAGPTTARALERAGAETIIEAPAPGGAGIAQALRELLPPPRAHA